MSERQIQEEKNLNTYTEKECMSLCVTRDMVDGKTGLDVAAKNAAGSAEASSECE